MIFNLMWKIREMLRWSFTCLSHRCRCRFLTNGSPFCRSMDKYRDTVDKFSYIARLTYATDYKLWDCCNVLGDPINITNNYYIPSHWGETDRLPSNHIGKVGMSWCEKLEWDLWPIVMLANWLQSKRRALHWSCPEIWWNLLCDEAEWTRPHDRTDRMEP